MRFSSRLASTGLFLGLVFTTTPAFAQHQNGSPALSGQYSEDGLPSGLSEEDADTLKPGEFLWKPDGSAGPVYIKVDLDRQVAFVYRGDTLIGISTISSGRDGYETPIGVFPILQKEVKHNSTLYNSAPMPYMQRLTWDGVALHAGTTPGTRTSHGCVHLPIAFAKSLYAETALGGIVTITGTPPLLDAATRPPGDAGPVTSTLTSAAPTATSKAVASVAAADHLPGNSGISASTMR